MKKAILFLSLSVALMLTGLTMAFAQEAPNPQKDTVNIDTDAKPTYYYATEDEKTKAENTKGKSPVALIGIIVGAVIIVGGVVMILLKKNNNK
jgi:hypothetical protein